MNIFKKLIILTMVLFYVFAGINHFINPLTYINLIPPYLPFPEALNYLAGFFEIVFATLIIPTKTRKYASWAIILMLLAFMPTHIFMIQRANLDPLTLGKFRISPLIAWIRIPLQAILVLWAYWCSQTKFKLI